MKYLILLFSVLLFSCAPKIIPLKGNYPTTPMIFKSTSGFDQTWDRLIDIFAQKGLSIKIIDRSSGLIVSEKYLLSATIESKDGAILDNTAFIVIPKYVINGKPIPVTGSKNSYYSVKKQLEANPVYGEWNVRIKKDDTGSLINININNITYEDALTSSKYEREKPLFGYKSTGVFEKQLADLINK